MKINSLLVVFLVSLSFFRIDLTGGVLSFAVTPQLLISLIIIFTSLLKGFKIKNTEWQILVYILLLLLLLFYFLFTIFFNYHGTLQFKRYFLFTEIILTAIAFLALFKDIESEEKKLILKKWIRYSINTHIVWILAQLILFVNGLHFYPESWETWNFINPLPHSIGSFLPRLEGGFLDPNVCGYYFSFLYFINEILENKKNRLLLILFILLTLSRSAIAAFAICILLFKIYNITISKKTLKNITLFSVPVILIIFVIVNHYGIWSKIIKGLTIRFSDKGSTNIHNSLIELGIEETFKSVETFFFGNGFSSSPFFAYDLVKGMGNKWKYANFHSEYITLYFESGILGFLLYYFILSFPFLCFKKIKLYNLPFFILILLQGLFYQQYNFHYYWIIIVIILSINLRNEKLYETKQ
uniref:O-antigen ligase family protein n=1 Tax=Flavobacterium sp. TaxID=239 RepID=UPI00404A4059